MTVAYHSTGMIPKNYRRNHHDRGYKNQTKTVQHIGILRQQPPSVGFMLFSLLCLQLFFIPSTVVTAIAANEMTTTTTSTVQQYYCDVPIVKGYQLLYSTKSLNDYKPYHNRDIYFVTDDDFCEYPRTRDDSIPLHDGNIICYEPNELTIAAIIPRPCYKNRFNNTKNGTITTTKVTYELQKTRNDESSVDTTVAVVREQTELTYPYYLYGKRNKKVNETTTIEILGRELPRSEPNEQYKLITTTSLVRTTGQVVVEEIMDRDVLRFYVTECGDSYTWEPPNQCDQCDVKEDEEVCLGSICIPSGNYYSFHLVVTGFTVIDLNFAVTLPIRTTFTNGTKASYEESFNHDEYFDPPYVPASESRFTGTSTTGSTNTLPNKRITYWNGTAVQGGYDEYIKMIEPKMAGQQETPTHQKGISRSHSLTDVAIVPSRSETGAYFAGPGWFPCCTCDQQWVKTIVFPNRMSDGIRINFDSYILTFEYVDKCFENGNPVSMDPGRGPKYIVEVRRNGKVIRTHSKKQIERSPNTIRNGTKVVYHYTSTS